MVSVLAPQRGVLKVRLGDTAGPTPPGKGKFTKKFSSVQEVLEIMNLTTLPRWTTDKKEFVTSFREEQIYFKKSFLVRGLLDAIRQQEFVQFVPLCVGPNPCVT